MSSEVFADLSTLLFAFWRQAGIVDAVSVVRYGVVPLAMPHDMEDWRHLLGWFSALCQSGFMNDENSPYI